MMAQDLRKALREFALQKMRELESERKPSLTKPEGSQSRSTKIKINRGSSKAGAEKRPDECQAECESKVPSESFQGDTSEALHQREQELISTDRHSKDVTEISSKKSRISFELKTGLAREEKMSSPSKDTGDSSQSKPSVSYQKESKNQLSVKPKKVSLNTSSSDKSATAEKKVIQIKITSKLPEPEKQLHTETRSDSDSSSDNDSEESEDESQVVDGLPWRTILEDGELTPSSDSDEESEEEKNGDNDEIKIPSATEDNEIKDKEVKEEEVNKPKDKKSSKHKHKSKHKKQKHKKSKKKKKKSKHKTDDEKDTDSKKHHRKREKKSKSSSRKDSVEGEKEIAKHTSERWDSKDTSKTASEDTLKQEKHKEPDQGHKRSRSSSRRNSGDSKDSKENILHVLERVKNISEDTNEKEHREIENMESKVPNNDRTPSLECSHRKVASEERTSERREKSRRNEDGKEERDPKMDSNKQDGSSTRKGEEKQERTSRRSDQTEDRKDKDGTVESQESGQCDEVKQEVQPELVSRSRDGQNIAHVSSSQKEKAHSDNPDLKLDRRSSKSQISEEKQTKDEKRSKKERKRESQKLLEDSSKKLVKVKIEHLEKDPEYSEESTDEKRDLSRVIDKSKEESGENKKNNGKLSQIQFVSGGKAVEGIDTLQTNSASGTNVKKMIKIVLATSRTTPDKCTASSSYEAKADEISTQPIGKERISQCDTSCEDELVFPMSKESFGSSKEIDTVGKDKERGTSVVSIKEQSEEERKNALNKTIFSIKQEEKEEGEAVSTDAESNKDFQERNDTGEGDGKSKNETADGDGKKDGDHKKAKGDEKNKEEKIEEPPETKKEGNPIKAKSSRSDRKDKEKCDKKEETHGRKRHSEGRKEKKDKRGDKEEGAIDSDIEEGEITKRHKKSKKKDKKKERDSEKGHERDKDRKDKRHRSESRAHSHSRSHKKHKRSRSRSRSDDYDSEGSVGKKALVEKSYFSESRGCWVTTMVPKEESDISSPSGDELSDPNELYDISDTYIRHPPRERRTVFERLGGGRFDRRDDRRDSRRERRDDRREDRRDSRRDRYERPYGFRQRRRSYSRSRSRSPKLDIDKKKLLEIAKANALMKMRAGELPPNISISESFKKEATTFDTNETIQRLTDRCKAIANTQGGSSDDDSPVNRPVMSDEDEEGELSKPFVRHPFRVNQAPPIVLNIKDAVQIPVQSKDNLRVQFPVSSGSQHRKKEDDTIPNNPGDPYGQWTAVEKPKPTPPPPPPPPPATKDTAAPTSTQALTPTTATTPATPAIPATTTAAATVEAPYIPGVSNVQPPKPVAEQDKVFEDAPGFSYDIGQIVSARLKAARQLQSNPHNVEALTVLHHSQQQIQTWAHSTKKPGLFTGSTDATFLRPEELAHPNRKFQAWIKKDMFLTAAPVNTDIGRTLMEKMGWQQGEGLGKNKEGNLNPLLLEIKTDRQGLVAAEEKPKKKGEVSKVIRKDLSGKHPVMALNELCNKRRWGKPDFEVVREDGPAHKKNFVFKVRIKNEEYMPTVPSGNKKDAKAMAATVALQKMGLIPT